MTDGLFVYVLDGGRIEILDWSVFASGQTPGTKRVLADPCYLIRHPAGTLVWDTGVGDVIAGETEGRLVKDFAVFHVDTPLGRQLEEVGTVPGEVTYLALSHLHPDHVGNVDLFPSATLLLQRDEYESVFGTDSTGEGLEPRVLSSLRGNPVQLLDGDHDVFGDGSVVVKALPGHTVGSQSLLVRLASGAVLISGDIAHSESNWSNRVVPTFNVDAERSLASMEAAAAILEQEQATLWIQHEANQFHSLRKPPDSYR